MKILNLFEKIVESYKMEKKLRKKFNLTKQGYKELDKLTKITGIDLSNIEIIDLTKDDVEEIE